jgi:hypothetical protein
MFGFELRELGLVEVTDGDELDADHRGALGEGAASGEPEYSQSDRLV